ncbi:NAD(+) synthase [bacterium]|nr:NAD(+) synthase [bacterium]
MLTKVEATAHKIEEAIKEFCEIAVIAVSGGVDSAVVASAACAALGPEHVILVSLPISETDRGVFNRRSAELAAKLASRHLKVDLTALKEAFDQTLKAAIPELTSKVTQAKPSVLSKSDARIRTLLLYAVSEQLSASNDTLPLKRIRVIGSANLSEELIGYNVKGGDALADFFPLGDLFKSEVYQLARHYEVLPEIINAPPTSGLWGQKPFSEEVGFTHEALEPAFVALLRALRRGIKDNELAITTEEFARIDRKVGEFVIKRFTSNKHKRVMPRKVPLRGTEFVKDIFND